MFEGDLLFQWLLAVVGAVLPTLVGLGVSYGATDATAHLGACADVDVLLGTPSTSLRLLLETFVGAGATSVGGMSALECLHDVARPGAGPYLLARTSSSRRCCCSTC